MKGLTWYCRVVFSLFILICAALIVTRLIKFSPQVLTLVAMPVIYIIITALCFVGVKTGTGQVKKGWVIFGLVWSLLIVLMPLILAALSSYTTLGLFTLLTAGYEWSFIALAAVSSILFIPVVVFFAIRLSRMGNQVNKAPMAKSSNKKGT
jgi:hypothetical protein